MLPSQVKTAADARAIVEARGLSHVKVGVTDADGVMRGKYLAAEKFFSVLDSGFGFCDVVLGWDSNDQAYDNVSFTGWHTAYPDVMCRVLPDTCRPIPFEDGMLFFLAEFMDRGGELCPRGILRKVLKRADAMGFAVPAAAEFEFFLFEETPHTLREKNFRNLKSLTPGFFGYSILRAGAQHEYYRDLLALCEEMRMPIEGLHTETGPGVLEAAIKYCGALEAADRAALFKTFTKIFSQKRGLMATFMAKWSRDWPGQSGHLHLSLKDKAGKPVFHDASAPHGISQTMRHFIGGQQALMPELLAMVASTINAYTRLIPGFWAPTVAAWGIENRTTALRLRAAWNTASRRRILIPTSRSPPPSVRACGASNTRSSRTRRSPATPMRRSFH
jgi:glutamine synthetase